MSEFEKLNRNAQYILLLETLSDNEPVSLFDVYISKLPQLKKEILYSFNIDLNQPYYKYFDDLKNNIDLFRTFFIQKITLKTDILNNLKITFTKNKLEELKSFEYQIYWNDLKRKNNEVDILIQKLQEFYEIQDEEDNLIDFVHSKRPWGSKNIAASITYNLGWDKEDRLVYNQLPQNIKEEAIKLYNEVIINIEIKN